MKWSGMTRFGGEAMVNWKRGIWRISVAMLAIYTVTVSIWAVVAWSEYTETYRYAEKIAAQIECGPGLTLSERQYLEKQATISQLGMGDMERNVTDRYAEFSMLNIAHEQVDRDSSAKNRRFWDVLLTALLPAILCILGLIVIWVFKGFKEPGSAQNRS